jgi:hypothetical protein
MSYYDVAAGISQAGLNQILTALFANGTAQQKLFNGTASKDVDPLGTVNLAYQVVACPSIGLAPPDQADWDAAYKAPGVTTMPASGVFQLTLQDVKVQVAYGSASLKAEGVLKAYATFTLANTVLALVPLAVWIDESAFSGIDKLIVNQFLIPQILTLVTSTLSAIPLPQIGTVEGQTFQAPIAQIVGQQALVVATAAGSVPVDLTGYVNAAADVYVLGNIRLLNNILARLVDGQPVKEEGDSGSSAWNASARIGATVDSLRAGIDGTATKVMVALSSISGYGELSGVGVGITKAALCPIGAAVDAISNPSDWDKVISNFSLSYIPDPLPVPVSLTASTSGTSQSLSVSVGSLSSVQVIAAPQWSGSVTGTVLAAAAAGFVDLLSVTFGKLIINKILSDNAQNIHVLNLPEIGTSVEGVKVQLVIPNGAVAAVHGSDAWIQPFTVQFS